MDRVLEVGGWGVVEEGVEMAAVQAVGGRVVGDMVSDVVGLRGRAFESGNPQLSDLQPFLHEIALVADALDRLRFTPPNASNVGVGALVAIEDDEVLGAEVNADGTQKGGCSATAAT
jgi:hypothetical protein